MLSLINPILSWSSFDFQNIRWCVFIVHRPELSTIHSNLNCHPFRLRWMQSLGHWSQYSLLHGFCIFTLLFECGVRGFVQRLMETVSPISCLIASNYLNLRILEFCRHFLRLDDGIFLPFVRNIHFPFVFSHKSYVISWQCQNSVSKFFEICTSARPFCPQPLLIFSPTWEDSHFRRS